uniref:Ribonuclease P protein subunit p20 n=1 Tax=Parasteatoda tepidariorum TaxID=114398 RepID=A0A2L2YB92_PARTP|nr:ribonuclease P protein subunit p20 [Parasteatoda tepidariorum]
MSTPRKSWKSKTNKEDEKSLDTDDDYLFQKRLPPSLPRRPNDVYVNQKTPFIAQFNKCKTLLSKEKEIHIHGLGAAVNTAVNLALQLKTFYLNTIVLDTTTSSVELIDDFTPLNGKFKPKTNTRKNSVIHIKLTNVIQESK